jgi:phenylalanine-4-hydroxylase
MRDEVKKVPYSIQAAYTEFDITKPQPQLFVTPDFAYLQEVLEEFANTMAVRKGGWRGLNKLIGSKQIGTIELSTGLQISGVFARMIQNEDNEVVYFETRGPTALAYREKEVIGHGVNRHRNGFRSPLGKLKGINLAIENMGPRDLQAYNFYDGKPIAFEFESGITVEGLNVTGMRNVRGELMLIQFTGCTVKYKDEILFSPEMGDFDMAVGKEIVSAFAGAADFLSFNIPPHRISQTKTVQSQLAPEDSVLNNLYRRVRTQREEGNHESGILSEVFEKLRTEFNNDWLLPLEIYELVHKDPEHGQKVRDYLLGLQRSRPGIAHLIADGLDLIDKNN